LADRDQAAATIGALIDHFHAATVGLSGLAPVIGAQRCGGWRFLAGLAADLPDCCDTATFTPAFATGHLA
jgi:hypothetical protein